MQQNWSWVIASYIVTAVALAGYVIYLRGRVRDAEAAIRETVGERE